MPSHVVPGGPPTSAYPNLQPSIQQQLLQQQLVGQAAMYGGAPPQPVLGHTNHQVQALLQMLQQPQAVPQPAALQNPQLYQALQMLGGTIQSPPQPGAQYPHLQGGYPGVPSQPSGVEDVTPPEPMGHTGPLAVKVQQARDDAKKKKSLEVHVHNHGAPVEDTAGTAPVLAGVKRLATVITVVMGLMAKSSLESWITGMPGVASLAARGVETLAGKKDASTPPAGPANVTVISECNCPPVQCNATSTPATVHVEPEYLRRTIEPVPTAVKGLHLLYDVAQWGGALFAVTKGRQMINGPGPVPRIM